MGRYYPPRRRHEDSWLSLILWVSLCVAIIVGALWWQGRQRMLLDRDIDRCIASGGTPVVAGGSRWTLDEMKACVQP